MSIVPVPTIEKRISRLEKKKVEKPPEIDVDLSLDGEETPTFELLLQWRDDLNSEWSSSTDNTDSLDRQQDMDEALYFQNYEVTAVDQDPYSVKTGSAPEDVDSAIDSLVPSRVLVTVIPQSGDDKAKKNAERLARAGRATLEAWRRPKDILRMVVTDVVLKRYAIARVMFDERFYNKELTALTAPQKKVQLEKWTKSHRNELPIILDLRPPRYTRWRELRGRMIIVVEDYETTVMEARQLFWRFPKARSYLEQLEPFNIVRISDVWYEKWRTLAIDDRRVFDSEGGVLEHGYAEIPYAACAYRELTYDEPAKRFRGPLSNAEGLYPAESRVLSMQLTMLAFNAWRTHVGHTVDGREIRIIPGHYIDIDKNRGEYLELLRGDPVPDELLRTETVLDQLIQRNSASATPRGTDNARSAQQLYAAQALRGLKTESARDGLARFVEKCLSFALMEIDTIVGERITLPFPVRSKDVDFGFVSVGPKDINGYWSGYRVDFGRRLDPAALEQAKTLQLWAQNHWISWDTSHQLAEVLDDIAEEEEKMILESVDRLPFMIETAAVDQVEAFYTKDSWQYQTIKEQVQQGRVQSAQNSTQQPPNSNGNVSGQDLPSTSQGGVAPQNNTPGGQ